jgi:2'-5' RNA ligase
MLRLFVAVDIPEDIRTLVCGMGATIPGSRAVPTEQLHLTLKFLGDMESGMLLDIRQALAVIAHEPFSMSLKTVGHFPPRGNPRVLWVGIHPVQEVVSLRNKVEKALSDIGIEREKRKFSPHVTLARLKDSPIQRVSQFLAGNSLFETPSFRIDEFQLYSSTLTPRGAIHTIQESFPLQQENSSDKTWIE